MSVDHVCAHDMGLLMECGFCQGIAQERARAVAVLMALATVYPPGSEVLCWDATCPVPRHYPACQAAREYCAEKP